MLGILLPSIVEKLVLYFLGASLYGIPLADVSGVMSRIAANEPFTHIFLIRQHAIFLIYSFLDGSTLSAVLSYVQF